MGEPESPLRANTAGERVYRSAPLIALDTLWLQVAGTLCNIACTHCFISCSPRNHAHEMMSLDDVRRRLAEARELGVREYYFTGGEPFMNREIIAILEETLRQGPATVLTNGMLLKRGVCLELKRLFDESEYSLDIRVSLDGSSEEEHDVIRGAVAWARAMEGLRNLGEAGLNPVITVSEAAVGAATAAGRERLVAMIRSAGFDKPRLKILPLFRIGAEESRSRGYAEWERIDAELSGSFDTSMLQCSSCRMVTSRGVFVCPILIDAPDARMGDSLAEAMRPFELRHGACHTCWVEGASCRT